MAKGMARWDTGGAKEGAALLSAGPSVLTLAAAAADSGDMVHLSDVHCRVTGVTLTPLSAEDIRRMSARRISQHGVYACNLPKRDGPNDPYLGSSDRRIPCQTCRNGWFGCNGHLGDIALPLPLYNPGYMREIYKLLQAVCFACSCGLWPAAAVDKVYGGTAITRFHGITDAGKGQMTCRHCGAPQPKYSRKGMFILRNWPEGKLDAVEALENVGPALARAGRRLFTPADAADIFDNMSDGTIRELGMDPAITRPGHLIWRCLPVIPPNTRPANYAAEGSKRKAGDDATTGLTIVLKTIRSLRQAVLNAAFPERASRRRRNRGLYDDTYSALGGEIALATASAVAAGNGTRRSEKAGDGGVGGEDGGATDTGKPKSRSFHPADVYLPVAELMVKPGSAEDITGGELTPEELAALEAVGCTDLPSITPEQASALWAANATQCEALQNTVAVLLDNGGQSAPLAQQRCGAAQKGLFDKWRGKQGRFRAMLAAKRCDFTARSVISPSENLDINQVGVPWSIMNTLTVPEIVHRWNMDGLQRAVWRGPGARGGATRVVRPTGEQIVLALCRDRRSVLLAPGDAVERHLVDGDVCLFNRQPSLHKPSMLAVVVVGVDGDTFQVELANTAGYNADFDGDEMNMHALQTLPAAAEAAVLMSVPANIVNPQNNAPFVGMMQDGRVGTMLLTSRKTVLTLDVMHQCVGAIAHPLPGKTGMPPPSGTCPITGEPTWTGKQLVSLLLPPIFLQTRVRGAGPDVGPDDPGERFVSIENGVLVHGTLCKETLGTGSGTIIHLITWQHGPMATNHFISDLQRVINTWLPTVGLTIGLADCMASVETRAAIGAEVARVDGIVTEVANRVAALPPGALTPGEAARIEGATIKTLTAVVDFASKMAVREQEAAAAAGRGSGLWAIVQAGSKGSAVNVAQIMGALGQQIVGCKRPGPVPHSGRTYPCFPAHSGAAGARGFAGGSFMNGLVPHEYWAHSEAGREGVASTASSTSEAGHIYRTVKTAAENVVAQWDGTARQGNVIVQFIAGGDGLDVSKVARVSAPFLLLGNADLVSRLGSGVSARYVAAVLHARDWLRRGMLSPAVSECRPRLLLPVDVRALVARAAFESSTHGKTQLKKRARMDDALACALGPLGYEDAVWALLAELEALVAFPEACMPLRFTVLMECAPAVVEAAGLTPAVFSATIAREIVGVMRGALLAPGSPLGVVAAQSLGEPATQFTLDVFHLAGQMQQVMTVGVPRCQELVYVAKDPATPYMLIPLREGVNAAAAEGLAASLQFLCLDGALSSCFPAYCPVVAGAGSAQEDADCILVSAAAATGGGLEGGGHAAAVRAALGLPPSPLHPSPWVLRGVLNRTLLTTHRYTPERVARAIASQLPDIALSIVYSPTNARTWLLRIRLVGDATEAACRKLHVTMRSRVLLGGIPAVSSARVITLPRVVEDASTKTVSMVATPLVETVGSSLQALATRDGALDWCRTVTNNVWEVLNVLGLVAARGVLLRELDAVLSYSGQYVDIRHLRLIVCNMTSRGFIMPNTRHGMEEANLGGVMHRASFEEAVCKMMQAAVMGESDPLSSVVGSIVFGQVAPVGTGTVGIERSGGGAVQPLVPVLHAAEAKGTRDPWAAAPRKIAASGHRAPPAPARAPALSSWSDAVAPALPSPTLSSGLAGAYAGAQAAADPLCVFTDATGTCADVVMGATQRAITSGATPFYLQPVPAVTVAPPPRRRAAFRPSSPRASGGVASSVAGGVAGGVPGGAAGGVPGAAGLAGGVVHSVSQAVTAPKAITKATNKATVKATTKATTKPAVIPAVCPPPEPPAKATQTSKKRKATT